jgi:hypothetical protein
MKRILRPLMVGIVIVLGVLRARRASQGAKTANADRRVVRYHVPVGQDAAAALAAVRNAGFEARVDIAGGDEDVLVTCDAGHDDERLRRVLSNAPIDMAGHPFDTPPVTFAEE